MLENRALFKYELAAVLIIKDEAIYVREWIEYHQLVGIEHFYIYDNDSSDELKDVLQPYVERGIVTYRSIEGRCAQIAAYNDALSRRRFECRYMICLDIDEFIYPKNNRRLLEFVDEIFAEDDAIAELLICWSVFGSNGLEYAEPEKGVLDRFTRRAVYDNQCNNSFKSIVNPRGVKCYTTPHNATCFAQKRIVNAEGKPVRMSMQGDKLKINLSGYATDIIAINHYVVKSREEYNRKIARGDAFYDKNPRSDEHFDKFDRNDIFDDGIVRYRAELLAFASTCGGRTNTDARILNALLAQLLPELENKASADFYRGQLHVFLTCHAAVCRLRRETSLLTEPESNLLEEAAINCVLKSLESAQEWQIKLLFSELPRILKRPFAAVGEIRKIYRDLIIPDALRNFRITRDWNNFIHFDFIHQML